MPEGVRWWTEAAKRYAAERWKSGEFSEETVRTTVRSVNAWPARFSAAGLPVPDHARNVIAENVLRWKARPMGPGRHGTPVPLAGTSAITALCDLRGFLRWARNPVADIRSVWKMRRADPRNRRWFDSRTLDLLMGAATDRERLLLALGAWTGLRRREIASLTVADVDTDLGRPTLSVLRKGGARKLLPMSRATANAVRPFVMGRERAAPLYPMSYRTIQADLSAVAVRVGLSALAAHDLRRSFGRILYREHRVDLNTIRVLYNHRSTEMTLHYIGADSDDMADAVGRFDRPPRPHTEVVPVGA